jgi:hypothetical protein
MNNFETGNSYESGPSFVFRQSDVGQNHGASPDFTRHHLTKRDPAHCLKTAGWETCRPLTGQRPIVH